jgi:hypothetical protein
MSKKRSSVRAHLLVALVVMSIFGGGFALASHVAEVDPATVPEGVLVSHNDIPWVGVKAIRNAVETSGADIHIQHVALDPGEALPWHSHPGPGFLTVASGSVTVEMVKDGTCVRRVKEAGHGFFEKGDLVMRVVAGDAGAHNYVAFILPDGVQSHITPQDAPAECETS